ncbi:MULTISPECIES: hypothetical protein [unclassified Microcoleus]|uniref:hypothetical protein n=1 Tax=unclassified Microcoleus TaxID=2642155 RepID=UPI002FD6FADD
MVQQIPSNNSPALSLNDAFKQEISTSTKPLAVIVNPSESTSAFAGEIFELRVTVTNQGNQGAIINIYIDESSGLLRQWCSSPYESLALANHSSAEVTFRLAIPMNATPNTYKYLLVIDAPQHYPEDTPIRHEAQLQVLPPVQSAVRVNDPTFAILPATSAIQPAAIQPGHPLDITIVVYNRSDRVDRFRLTSPDLPSNWFTITYPEGLVEEGLVTERESLALNPGAKGHVQLRLLFPLNIKAGNYTPAFRLSSVNHLELVLMDVVYLQVNPIYKLMPELQTMIAKVGQEAGWFRLLLANSGNTLREINLSLLEGTEKPICTYSFSPEEVRIGSQATSQIDLRVKPNKWWRRPWFGKGLPIQFYVEFADTYKLPVPERLEGTLIWEARPLWHLILLLLTGAGAITSLIFLIWWFLFRPPTPPKIAEFTSISSLYQEATGDAISLSWQIRNPQQLQAIKIVGISPESGIALSSAVFYDFNQGIPRELQDFCRLERVLNCQNVRTDAQQAGNYVFQMEIFAKKGEQLADSQKTSTIKIGALALPKIVEFSSTKPIYQEIASGLDTISPNISTGEGGRGASIALNWQIANPEQLQELKIVGRQVDGTVIAPLKTYNFLNGIPSELSLYCAWETNLICRKVPTKVRKAGDYIFEVFVVPKQANNQVTISQKTENIRINSYQAPLRILELAVNGQEALPKYILQGNPLSPARNLVISWKVAGDKNTKVELLPSPGTVSLEGAISYPISQQVGSETITLLVTGINGKRLSRTVTIEKVSPPVNSPSKPDVKGVLPRPLSPQGTDSKKLPAPKPRNLPIAPGEAGKNSSIFAPAAPPSPSSLPSLPKRNIPTPPPLIQSNPQPNNLSSSPSLPKLNIPTPPPLIQDNPQPNSQSSSDPSTTPSPTPSLQPSPMEVSPQFD